MYRNCVKITTFTISLHIFIQIFAVINFWEFFNRDFDYSTVDDDLNHDIVSFHTHFIILTESQITVIYILNLSCRKFKN